MPLRQQNPSSGQGNSQPAQPRRSPRNANLQNNAPRSNPQSSTPVTKPNIFVVTDIGNDYDDFMALMILGHYHKQGKISIKAIVVTGDPIEKRCQLARGLFENCMGIHDVQIVCGSATVKQPKNVPAPAWQNIALSPEFAASSHPTCKKFKDVAREVLQNAANNADKGGKIRLLSIACLKDTWTIISAYEDLFKKAVEQVHVQGGCKYETREELLSPKGDAPNSEKDIKKMEKFYTKKEFYKPGDNPTDRFLAPRNDAKNNRDEMNAAREFFRFIQNGNIPCTVYTKQAAFASQFKKDVFNKDVAAPNMKKVAEYLFEIHDIQKKAYYEDAVNPDRRHQPYMNTQWFVSANTRDLPEGLRERLATQDKNPNQKTVTADELMPFTVVTSYDPIAALGCIQDVTPFPKIKGEDIGCPSVKVTSVGNMRDKDGEILARDIHSSLDASLRDPL